MGLFRDHDALGMRGLQKIAYVVVEVTGLLAGRNPMDVEIENFRVHERDVDEPRLFLRLAQRHFVQREAAVGVAAELQPPVQLAMVREQRPLAIRRDDDCRSGEVSRKTRAQRRVGVPLDQLTKAGD